MKKFLAILALVALLVQPVTLFAREFDEAPTPTSAARPGSGSTMDVLAGTGVNASKQIASLAEAGAVVGCQTGGFGGALAQTFGAALQQAIPAFIRGQLGGALNKLAAQAGPFGQVVQAAGNILINKLSTYVQNQIGQLFGGAAAQTVGQVAAGLGAGVGVAAGALGGAAGVGAAVPVNETGQVKTDVGVTRQITETKIAPDARRIAEATETSAQAKCVGDPLINKIKNALLSLIFKSTIDFVNSGFNGDTAIIQNIREFLGASAQAVADDFISNQLSGLCSTQRGTVQTILLSQYQYETNVGGVMQCRQDAARDATNFEAGVITHETLYTTAFNNSLTWDIVSLAQQELATQQLAQLESDKITIIKNDGIKDKIICSITRQPPADGSTYCSSKEGIALTVFTGKNINSILEKQLNTPTDQLLNADEIGELIDALTASVTQVALQGVDGLLGLSSKSGNKGSYLDEMVSEATGVASGEAQEAVSGDIEAALAVEEAYLELVQTVHIHLSSTRTTYQQAIQCYTTKAAGGGTNAQTAQTKLANASSTVATVIDPQLKNLGRLMTDSEDAVDALRVLAAEAATVLTTDDVVSVNDRFTTLMQSGLVHNATDLTYLQNNFDTAAGTLDLLRVDANAMLSECQTL